MSQASLLLGSDQHAAEAVVMDHFRRGLAGMSIFQLERDARDLAQSPGDAFGSRMLQAITDELDRRCISGV